MKIEWSDQRNEIALALSKAQGAVRTASKDNTATVQMKSGGKYSYKYSTLDDIWGVARKPLADNELSVVQIPTNDEAGFYLETTVMHSSGQFVTGRMTLPVVADRMSVLQAMGSAITYARRYMLASMVGVTTGDDDDGQNASNIERAQPEGMAKEKLLYNLNRIDKIKGFYNSPDEVAEALALESWPAPDNIELWRSLFAEARDHALEIKGVEKEAEDEEEQAPWRPTKKEFFEAAIARTPTLTANDIVDQLRVGGWKEYDTNKAHEMWAYLETTLVNPEGGK